MKILIIGAGGRLGTALMRAYRDKYDLIGFKRSHLDLGKFERLRINLETLSFDVLINAAAYTNVDHCEETPPLAFKLNADAPGLMAEVCAQKKSKFIHFSTDYVFDGEKREPYVEEDVANPISVYGASKKAGEEKVLAAQDRHLVVRVSWVFGPDRPSFIDQVIARARENEEVSAIADKFSAPALSDDIAEMLPQFFDVDLPGGLLHYCNTGQCSWQEYAQHALDCCHEFGIPLQAKTVAPLQLADMENFLARRPVYSVLSNDKYTALAGKPPRPWRDAVADYIKTSYSKK